MGGAASLISPSSGRTRAPGRFVAPSLRGAESREGSATELHAEVDVRRQSNFSISSGSDNGLAATTNSSGSDVQRLLCSSSGSMTVPAPQCGGHSPRLGSGDSADTSCEAGGYRHQRRGARMPLATPELLREMLTETGMAKFVPTSPEAKSATLAAVVPSPKLHSPEVPPEEEDSVLKSWTSVLPPPGILYSVERATRSKPSRPSTRGRTMAGSLSSASSSSLTALQQPPTVSFTGVRVLKSPCRIPAAPGHRLSTFAPVESPSFEDLPLVSDQRQHSFRAKTQVSRRFTGFRKDVPSVIEGGEEDLGNSVNPFSNSAAGGLSLRSSGRTSTTNSGSVLAASISSAPFSLVPPALPHFSATDPAAAAVRRMSEQLARATQEVAVHAACVNTLLRCWGCVLQHYDTIVLELGALVLERHPEFAPVLTASSASADAQRMLDAVGEAVVSLPRPDEMFTALLETGALQRRSGISHEHFLAMQSAFMTILPKYLPAELQAVYESAWAPFWKVMLQLLEHGRTSARGEWHAADQQATFLTEARRAMDAIMARKTPAERGTFMLEMLECAVAADASMERFAILRERRCAVRCFNGIMRVLDGTEDLAATQVQLEDLAFRHSVFGLDAAAMRGFRQPFIDTCHYSMQKKKCLELWRPETPQSLGAFWDYVTESWAKSVEHTEKSRAAQAERAPDGSEPFCLMFTDIEGSTRLWERNAAVMADAVEAHHRIVRGAIADYGAYEVKTVGDSFVIAAKDVMTALRIALAIQLELMSAPIAKGFEMPRDTQGGGPADCWRADSLRVRIGIHLCRDASAVYDSVQRRYDYYGPSVNCTARVESAACGGQILMTHDALEMLQAMPEFGSLSLTRGDATSIGGYCAGFNAESLDVEEHLSEKVPLAEQIAVRDWGAHTFKGIEKGMQLYSVLPRALAARVFTMSGGSSSGSSLLSTPMDVPMGFRKNSLTDYLGGRGHAEGMHLML